MRIKRSILLLFALTALFLLGCEKETIDGNGPVQEELRSTPEFTKISTSGSTGVKIHQGNSFQVKLKGYSNLLPHFETKVVNGELRLGYASDVSVRNDNLEVHVVMPLLTGLKISGSSEIDANGPFPAVQESTFSISGSGKMYIEEMQTNIMNAQISGSGEIFGFGLRSMNAEIDISGSGIAEVFVENQLRANISGSGTIFYRGNPTVQSTISGSGRVIPQ